MYHSEWENPLRSSYIVRLRGICSTATIMCLKPGRELSPIATILWGYWECLGLTVCNWDSDHTCPIQPTLIHSGHRGVIPLPARASSSSIALTFHPMLPFCHKKANYTICPKCAVHETKPHTPSAKMSSEDVCIDCVICLWQCPLQTFSWRCRAQRFPQAYLLHAAQMPIRPKSAWSPR